VKRAVAYLRVSTSKQADKDFDPEGYSLPAQREACYREAKTKGAEIIDEFMDRGETAKTADRPQFQRLLERVRAQRDVDYLIVDKVDRFARNVRDAVNIIYDLKAAGCQLVSVKERIDDTPAGQLQFHILIGIAEFYSSNNGTEALKGMTQKAKVGGTPGQAPLGYRNVHENIEDRIIRTIDIDPERAPHIQWAFTAYATGEWTVKELAEELASRGLRSRRVGKKPPMPLHYSRVANLLNNRYYIGKVSFRGKEYEGRHKPLVSEKLFHQVQEILTGRRCATERRRTHENYLKGTVFCGRCSKQHITSRLILMLANGHGGSYYYFFCRGRQQGNGCRQRFIQPDDVEEAVERFYKKIQLPGDQIEKLRQRLRDELADLRQKREREAKRLTIRVRHLEAAQDRLLDAMYAGLPMERFKAEQERIARETLEAKEALRGAQVNFEVFERTIEMAVTISANLYEVYRRATPRVRRVINQALFENLWVSTSISRKARVVGATFKEPLMVLARDLPDYVRDLADPLEPGDEAVVPELVFSGVGLNSDYLVPPAGIEPATHGLGKLLHRWRRSLAVHSPRCISLRFGATMPTHGPHEARRS
jgi:site-specific DNA recombinase